MSEQESGAEGDLPGARPAGRVLGLLLVAVLVAFSGQQLLSPVLAPLSRELRMTEFQLGLVITVAAVVFALGSLVWGRLVDRWGHRRVLLTGLVLGIAGLASFAVVCRLALDGGWSTGGALTAMLVTRSVLFGIGIGALPVAALSYVAATTTGERDRTRAVSLVGAAQALSLVLGPGLGGVLAVVELLLPVYLAPVLMAAVAVAVAVGLPRAPQPAADPAAPRGRGVGPFDPRVRPFLAVGLLLYLSLGMMQITLGFLVQDRLALDAEQTAGSVGGGLFAAGLVLVVMQAVVVPRLDWSPAQLMRVGAPIAALGYAGLALAPQLWLIVAALAVVAGGLGLAMPGYTAGTTLRVERSEQGAVAGLINATNGTTFIVGPLLGTTFYGLEQSLPYWLGALSCLVGGAVAVLNRRVAAVSPAVSATLTQAPTEVP
jgi:MFS family permease